MKKKILKFILAIFMILPCGAVMTACGNNDGDGDSPPTTQSPAKPGDSSASLTSVEAEVVTTDMLEKYDEDTKTFEIEYGDSMPRAEDFVVTGNYDDGSEKSLVYETDYMFLCPTEFYESRMVVREQPYEFAIVSGDKNTYFYIKIIKKNIEKPTGSNEEMTYNGHLHTYNISGFDSNLMTVENNKFVDAGKYTATVSLKDTNNYVWADGTNTPIIFDWSVSKLKLDKPAIVGEYTYSGSELTANLNFNGLADSMFEVSNNKKVNASTYDVAVKLNNTTNYEWKDTSEDTVTVSWTINPKKVLNNELPSIVGEDASTPLPTYQYTGTPIKAVLSEKFNGTFMSVEDDTQTEMGKHKLKIRLDSNHEFADETLKAQGYLELEWEIVEPVAVIETVNLSSYSNSSWVGTHNTLMDSNVKTIELLGLPNQVDVVYEHTKDGQPVSANDLITSATYVTTAKITLKSAYASSFVLPTAEDLEYIPVAQYSRYENIVIKADSIEISLTWKIYANEKTIEYTWQGEDEYVFDGTTKTPVVNITNTAAFECDYQYYKYNDSLQKYEIISGAPSEVGKYKVKANIVTLYYIMPANTIADFEFEIVAN